MAQASSTSAPTDASLIAPPPWDLAGRGAILLLRPAKGARPRRLLDLGGALAFVAYERSGVDPYLELLHVPYLTHSQGIVGPTIDRIWVTSQRSVVSGRANWGIPKDLADITLDAPSGGPERWNASIGGTLLASLSLQPTGPALPVFKPRRLGRLLQRMNGRLYATPIDSSGKVRFAKVEHLEFGPVFADVDPARGAAAVVIPSFRMGFHAADIS
jgi:hypothetical protein